MNIAELPKHHALLILHNERGVLGDSIYSQLQALSPAHRFFNQTVLDMETAKTIVSWAQTPYNDEKIALISFHTIGLEAQNALLKILEEPRDGVRFILITSNIANIIDTVLSRVLLVHHQEHNESLSLAEAFLNTDYGFRMKLPEITTLLSQVDEEDRKDRESIRAFILSLATVVEKSKAKPSYTQEVLEIAAYASDPSASGKALVEYLALLLPQTKV